MVQTPITVISEFRGEEDTYVDSVVHRYLVDTTHRECRSAFEIKGPYCGDFFLTIGIEDKEKLVGMRNLNESSQFLPVSRGARSHTT